MPTKERPRRVPLITTWPPAFDGFGVAWIEIWMRGARGLAEASPGAMTAAPLTQASATARSACRAQRTTLARALSTASGYPASRQNYTNALVRSCRHRQDRGRRLPEA